MIPELPPHNLLTEQSFLGCLILDSKAAFEVLGQAHPHILSYFYDLRNQIIMENIYALTDKNIPVDLVTLIQRLEATGELPNVGGAAYVSGLCDKASSPINAPYYAGILQELHTRRKLLKTCQSLKELALSGGEVNELLDVAEREVLAIRPDSPTDLDDSDSKIVLMNIMEQYERASKGEPIDLGLNTGLTDLDRLSGGIRRGEVIVIAGGTNSGKSVLGFQIATHVAHDQDNPVGYVSLEMRTEDLLKRSVSSDSRIPLKTCERGMTQEQTKPVAHAIMRAMKTHVYINDTSNRDYHSIEHLARKWKSTKKIGLLVVDHFHLIAESMRGETEIVKLSRASAGFKRLAKELDIPIILLAQLNRSSENDQRAPRLADLRGCGTIENDADFVWMLYPEPMKDNNRPPPDPRTVTLLLRKQRRGPRDAIVDLLLFGSITRFESKSKIE